METTHGIFVQFLPVLITLSLAGIILVALINLSQKTSTKKKYICINPNCKYEGGMEIRGRGNLLVLLILLCFFVVPGVIYFLLCFGRIYSCPNCHIDIKKTGLFAS